MITIPLIILGVVRPPEPRTQAKIRKLYVPVPVDQNVVRLDVAMNEAHLVNALNRAYQFGNVKPI